MRLMRQARRRDYIFRHVRNILPYLTLYKVINLMLNVFEKKYKISTPRSIPPFIKIEPTPICQLKCPGCMQSIGNYKKHFRNNMQINLDDFRRIVDPLSSGLLGISLSNHGEPLLHKNISSLISYAHDKNIAVSFPTNLSMKLDKPAIDKLVNSGLDSISVSLDGASEETYSKYRIGGDFSLVVNNVRLISEAKQRHNLKRPKLVWKFVIFDHNEHELDIVRKKYREFGFDDYELVANRQGKDRKQKVQTYKANLRKTGKGCFWLWHTMVIRWDGKVYPCCTHKDFNLGNAIHTNTKDIWRSDAYTELRQGFSSKQRPSKMNDICKKCMGFELAAPAATENLTTVVTQVEISNKPSHGRTIFPVDQAGS